MLKVTLIDIVRQTRINGHRFGAVDSDGRAFSYSKYPEKDFVNGQWTVAKDSEDINDGLFIGVYKLTCEWQNTIIDVEQLNEKVK